jgi:hypothetical protein
MIIRGYALIKSRIIFSKLIAVFSAIWASVKLSLIIMHTSHPLQCLTTDIRYLQDTKTKDQLFT